MMSMARNDPKLCPHHGGTMIEIVWSEPAMIRHGGYGETRTHRVVCCNRCDYAFSSSVTSTR